MIQTQTNNHVHEYATRPSGHYKIFLAGPSGTQLTTANQLTFDRVIFSAPSNKYAHIIGEPVHAGYANDPGLNYLPVKMIDPTGAYLPEGTYNFVWAWFWATDAAPQKDYMIPDYSTSFDIIIDSSSDDAGSLTDCVAQKGDVGCAKYLIGTSSSPGAKDTASPWPPYSDNYLFTNYDGDDPASDNGKRTFQPYWQDFVPASKAPAISEQAPFNIKEKNDDDLLAPIDIAGRATNFPDSLDAYPNMPAGGGESIPVTQSLKPMSIDGATAQGGTGGGSSDNSTMSSATDTGTTTDDTTSATTTVSASGTPTSTDADTAAPTLAAGQPDDMGTSGNGNTATQKKRRSVKAVGRHRRGLAQHVGIK